MTNTIDAGQDWWQALHSIADLVHRSGIAPEEVRLLREQLTEQGYSRDGIGKALDWMDQAAMTGNLMDTLSMFQPVSEHIRIDHALERLAIHPLLRRAVYICRRKGLINLDLAERLIEGLRVLDTRDWDEQEIESYLVEVLTVLPLGPSAADLAAMLVGRTKDLFN